MLTEKHISRDFLPEDGNLLTGLLKSTWGISVGDDYWQWKYFRAPFKTKGFVVQNQDGGIISFNGFWHRPTALGGKILPTAMSMDTMTHPEHQGQSFFRDILKQFISLLDQKEIVWGFTNPVSHKMFRKHLREFLRVDDSIPVLIFMVNPLSSLPIPKPIARFSGPIFRALHRLFLRFRRSKHINVELAQEIGEDFDQLWEEVRKDYYWIQNRGKDFVKWRYTSNPMRKYQIWKASEGKRLVGFLITTIKEEGNNRRGFLLDWLVSKKRDDVFRVLVKHALEWLILQKMDVVETWLLDHEKKRSKILRSYFFSTIKRRMSFLIFANKEIIEPNITKPDNFFLTIGDSDYLGTGDS
jgi:hypothetical protein